MPTSFAEKLTRTRFRGTPNQGFSEDFNPDAFNLTTQDTIYGGGQVLSFPTVPKIDVSILNNKMKS